MSCDIEGASSDGRLHRVARAPDAWEWPDWAYAGPDGTFGNATTTSTPSIGCCMRARIVWAP
jgi:hypothetical protein